MRGEAKVDGQLAADAEIMSIVAPREAEKWSQAEDDLRSQISDLRVQAEGMEIWNLQF